jgi:hypothetical protein
MTEINVSTLVAAKRTSRKRFKEMVDHYRKLGVTDAEIVRVMVNSREIVDPRRVQKKH